MQTTCRHSRLGVVKEAPLCHASVWMTPHAPSSSPLIPCLQDVRVLYHQMAGLDVDESEAPIQTNLDQILAYIRSHWEKVIERNRAETDNYLEYKVQTTS